MLQEAITSIAVRILKTEEGDVLGLMSKKGQTKQEMHGKISQAVKL